jgi:cobalt-precorrin 5A hydrolase
MKPSATDSENNDRAAPRAAALYALWVLTPNGLTLGRTLQDALPQTDLYLSERLAASGPPPGATPFRRLTDALARQFHRYRGHLFIMATGIVVRALAPLITHKTEDPAVVVLDEHGRFVISLLSGHIGGANRLTTFLAEAIGATPVITTATDVNRLPSVDLVAAQRRLAIENPAAIKTVNMAVLNGETIGVHDPYGLIVNALPGTQAMALSGSPPDHKKAACVFVDDRLCEIPAHTLILRPPSLAAGIGCNRYTPAAEIRELLFGVLAHHRLSAHSLFCLATVDVKTDETGLRVLADELDLPLQFFSRDALNSVDTIASASVMAEKHLGVRSVCEAAAILAAQNGRLIVPKQTTRNVTVAIARIASMS